MEVQTQLVDVFIRGEWFDFKAANGNRYSTRAGDVAALGQQLLNQPVVLEVQEKTSPNVNPHTGQPYVNRYLNAVRSAPVSAMNPALGTSTGGNGTVTMTTGNADPHKRTPTQMIRAEIAAQAVGALIAASDREPATLQRLLDSLAKWAETGQPVFSLEQELVSSPQLFTTPPDDIPF